MSDRTPQPNPLIEQTSLYEGMTVQVQLAPLWKRAFAFAVDASIIGAVSYVILLIATFVGLGMAGIAVSLAPIAEFLNETSFILLLAGALIVMLLMLILYDSYFIYFEYQTGTTPGKKLFGLKIVTLDGKRLSLGQCILRELFRHIDIGTIIVGPLCISLTERKQRLGDLAAKTLVTFSQKTASVGDYMYITDEQYHWMMEFLTPKPVDTELCQKYLSFSYPEYIVKKVVSPPDSLKQWEEVAREHFSNLENTQLDQRAILYFFAEHCFQTAKKAK